MALSRHVIASAGLELLNEVGLNGLTLRLIADKLGVKAPALYWHMSSKQELLDEMATQMFRDAVVDLPRSAEDGDWTGYLTTIAGGLRRMMLRYRDGAKVFSGTFFTDLRVPHEYPIRVLLDAGFDQDAAARALFTLYSFIVGFTIEEQAIYPTPGQRDERYDTRMTEYEGKVDPRVLAVVANGLIRSNSEDEFTECLTTVLAGIRCRLAS